MAKWSVERHWTVDADTYDEAITRASGAHDTVVARRHDEGCLGSHLGDCAVSGLFAAPERTPDMVTAKQYWAWHEGHWEVVGTGLELD